jgi:serine/threonine protein kinase
LMTMNPGEPLSVGCMLDGRYRIHKVLGQGGMGRVYLANDTRLANRPVAAKEMILGDGIQERKAIEDFNREASVLATLSHPSIPQVIDYFAESGRHYLVMEYVAGGDLQHHLDQLGPKARLPEDQVVRWARQILDVLHFLHSQKPPIIYRDLKPGNIMIDQHGRAMLVDFGIARFLPPGGRGTQIGSIGYAPPEQYLGKMEPRSDLYALAGTLHHLLTGRDPQLEPPFSFPPVRQLAPDVSTQTERVVMSALDKEIDKRPSTAREMRDLLPNPGPEAASGGFIASGSVATNPGGGLRGSMQSTIVLNRPVAGASPRKAEAIRPAPAPRPPAPPVSAKAQAVAHVKTQRSLKSRPGPPSRQPAPSSTSKTQDLGLKARSASPVRSSANPKSAPSAINRALVKGATPAKVPAALSSVREAVAPSPNPRTVARGAASTDEASRPVASTADAGRFGTSSTIVADAVPSTSPTGRAASGVPVTGAWLVASGDGAQFAIRGTRTVVGRAEGRADAVDIDLSRLRRSVERVSRRHAEIIKQGADYFIRDLGSLNGTYIAGRGRLGRDQLYKLRDRDELILGGAKLEFRKG